MKKKPTQRKRIQELYQRYMEHDLSADEFRELIESSDHPEFSEWVDATLLSSWAETNKRGNGFVSDPEEEDQSRVGSTRVKRIIKWMSAAAAAILMVLSVTQWRSNSAEGWITYNTGYAETMEIDLSDGSTVLLNASSQLRWNSDWESSGERMVQVSGEAYFDVCSVKKKDSTIPFYVQSEDVKIQVFGTSFNIEDYGEETKVFLHKGEIKLDLNHHPDSSLYMSGGDQVVITKKSHEVRTLSKLTIPEAASWTEGELRFTNVSLGEILPQLEAIYGVEFQIEDSSILEIPMDFGVPYTNWAVVQSALELALSVDISEKDGKVLINENK